VRRLRHVQRGLPGKCREHEFPARQGGSGMNLVVML